MTRKLRVSLTLSPSLRLGVRAGRLAVEFRCSNILSRTLALRGRDRERDRERNREIAVEHLRFLTLFSRTHPQPPHTVHIALVVTTLISSASTEASQQRRSGVTEREREGERDSERATRRECVCQCVCVRQRHWQRQRERLGKRQRETERETESDRVRD